MSTFRSKSGIVLVIVAAKIFTSRLAELTKLIDFSDRRIMQLRVFYAYSVNRYKNVNTEPLFIKNKHLLEYIEDDSAKPGQERFLVLATPVCYDKYVQGILKGEWAHNFSAGQIYVDEFHETKSDGALSYGGAISADEPGFGKVCILVSFQVPDSIL